MNYAYDYQGRRVSKADYTLSPARYTLFLYDGDQIIADYNEAGTLLRRYFYGPSIDEPICMMKSLGVYYYHFDGLGNVVALSDASRNIKEKYTYDVFGKPTIKGPSGEPRVASDVNNRYMFTGREFEPETGLYYYRARFYHPTLGRFIQTDPIGYDDGLNLYTYARNNPVNLIDPKGKISKSECKELYDKRTKQAYNNLKDCLSGCFGKVIGPIQPITIGCIIACGFTGPYVNACIAACFGADGTSMGLCTGACGLAYFQEHRSANAAYQRCNRCASEDEI